MSEEKLQDHGSPSLPPANLVLRNATVVDASGLRPGLDIAIRGEEIVDVGHGDRMVSAAQTAEIVDCRGAIIAPGFVNAHHHFATGLLRGAPASILTRNQKERLEKIVWPFERRLTHAAVRSAVRSSLLEATIAGTTAIIDHHVSSRCIDGVLDVIAEEVEASGLRGILCYEITDRDGAAVADSGLTETARFLTVIASGRPRLAGMVGLHAMATVGPETLKRAVALAGRFGAGLHLHLGEATFDNEESETHFGARPVARLAAADALTPRTLLAHAIHVTDDEMRIMGEQSVLVAHNPRSNAMNGVGIADLPGLDAFGCTIGLGGDGFTQDIRGEMSLIAPLQRLERRDPATLPPPSVVEITVGGNATILQRIAGWRVGSIAPGYASDLVMLDYEPVIPLLPHNAVWHVASGFPGATVRDMWVGGAAVLRDRLCRRLDAERIRHETEQSFKALWGL